MKTSSIRIAVLFIAILGVGIVVNTWAYLGEAHIERKELKDFPDQIGDWKKTGVDQVLDAPTLQVLRATDYLMRDFRRTDGQSANLYVGYYLTQRDGASYHSPLNCLPGSGWTLNEPGKVNLAGPNGSSFTANKYVIQNGEQKSLMLLVPGSRARCRERVLGENLHCDRQCAASTIRRSDGSRDSSDGWVRSHRTQSR